MRIAIQRFRMAAAFSLALWMAALAYVTGCVVPTFASPSHKPISSPQEAAPERAPDVAGTDLMADMPNCPHAAHHPPANPAGGKRAPSGGTSCCFFQLNVPAKMQAPQPQLVAAHVAVPVAIFDVTPVRTHSLLEFSPPVDHAGRDTLLQTHLLRI